MITWVEYVAPVWKIRNAYVILYHDAIPAYATFSSNWEFPLNMSTLMQIFSAITTYEVSSFLCDTRESINPMSKLDLQNLLFYKTSNLSTLKTGIFKMV